MPKDMQVWEVTGILWGGRMPRSFTYSDKIKKIYNIEDSELLISLIYYNKKNEMDVLYKNQQKKINQLQCKMFSIGEYGMELYMTEKNTLRCAESNKQLYEMLGGCIPRADIKKVDFYKGGNFQSLLCLANIEFMYNYEDAPNQGHYWIDDLETGETLSYIPENPTRDGYTFGGWYADSECTIEYDFTTPYIKKDLIEMETEYRYFLVYPKDYATYIYAKWIDN